MTFEEYEQAVQRTMNRNEQDHHKVMCNYALGISGEAGEVAELVKKRVFHGKAPDAEAMKKELGDVLWYVTALAEHCGLSLEEIAVANVDKLKWRYPNGFVEGGGNR